MMPLKQGCEACEYQKWVGGKRDWDHMSEVAMIRRLQEDALPGLRGMDRAIEAGNLREAREIYKRLHSIYISTPAYASLWDLATQLHEGLEQRYLRLR